MKGTPLILPVMVLATACVSLSIVIKGEVMLNKGGLRGEGVRKASLISMEPSSNMENSFPPVRILLIVPTAFLMVPVFSLKL